MDPPKPNPFANIRPTQSPYARQPGSPTGLPGSPRSPPGSPGSPGVPVARAQPAQPAAAKPWDRGPGAAAADGATIFGAARPPKPWERGATEQQRNAGPGSWGAAQPGAQPGTSQAGVHRGVSPVQTPVTATPAQPASPSRMTGANLAADFLSDQPGRTASAASVSTSPGASGLPRTQTQADSLAAAFLAEQEEEEQAASGGVEGPRTPAAATNTTASSPRGRPGMSPAVGEAEDDGVRVGMVSAEDEADAAAKFAASTDPDEIEDIGFTPGFREVHMEEQRKIAQEKAASPKRDLFSAIRPKPSVTDHSASKPPGNISPNRPSFGDIRPKPSVLQQPGVGSTASVSREVSSDASPEPESPVTASASAPAKPSFSNIRPTPSVVQQSGGAASSPMLASASEGDASAATGRADPSTGNATPTTMDSKAAINEPVNGSTLAADFLKGEVATAAAAATVASDNPSSGASLAAEFLAGELGPASGTKGTETGASLAAAFLAEQESASAATSKPEGTETGASLAAAFLSEQSGRVTPESPSTPAHGKQKPASTQMSGSGLAADFLAEQDALLSETKAPSASPKVTSAPDTPGLAAARQAARVTGSPASPPPVQKPPELGSAPAPVAATKPAVREMQVTQALKFVVANPQVRASPPAKVKAYLAQAMKLSPDECDAVLERAGIVNPKPVAQPSPPATAAPARTEVTGAPASPAVSGVSHPPAMQAHQAAAHQAAAHQAQVEAATQAQMRANDMQQSSTVTATSVSDSTDVAAQRALWTGMVTRHVGAAAKVLKPSDAKAQTAWRSCMAKMQTDGLCGDITLRVTGVHGNMPHQDATLHAHANVLMSHSAVFADMLRDKPQSQIPIEIAYSLQAVKVALQFCYTGEVNFVQMYNLTPEMVVEVLDLAQHYKIAGLANAAAAVIAEQMSVSNVCAVLSAASRFNRPDLVKRCIEFSERHLATLLKVPAFCELPDSAVMTLVQSDNSQANELDLFLGLVKWGRARFGSGIAPASPAAAASVNTLATAAATSSVKENLAAYLAHVRFPLIDGKSLDSHVESTGLVDESLLFEAYRFHSSGRIARGSSRFRRRGGSTDPVVPGGVQSPPAPTIPASPVASNPITPNQQVRTSYSMQSQTPATPNFSSITTPSTGPRPPSSAAPGPRPPSSPAPTATPNATAASPVPVAVGAAVPTSATAPTSPLTNPIIAQKIKTATAQWMQMCDFVPPNELVKGAYELLVHLSGGPAVNLTFQHVTAGKFGPLLRQTLPEDAWSSLVEEPGAAMDLEMWEMFIGAVRERELESLNDRQFKEVVVGWIVGAGIMEPPQVVSTVFRTAAGRAAKANAAGAGAGAGGPAPTPMGLTAGAATGA